MPGALETVGHNEGTETVREDETTVVRIAHGQTGPGRLRQGGRREEPDQDEAQDQRRTHDPAELVDSHEDLPPDRAYRIRRRADTVTMHARRCTSGIAPRRGRLLSSTYG